MAWNHGRDAVYCPECLRGYWVSSFPPKPQNSSKHWGVSSSRTTPSGCWRGPCTPLPVHQKISEGGRDVTCTESLLCTGWRGGGGAQFYVVLQCCSAGAQTVRFPATQSGVCPTGSLWPRRSWMCPPAVLLLSWWSAPCQPTPHLVSSAEAYSPVSFCSPSVSPSLPSAPSSSVLCPSAWKPASFVQ